MMIHLIHRPVLNNHVDKQSTNCCLIFIIYSLIIVLDLAIYADPVEYSLLSLPKPSAFEIRENSQNRASRTLFMPYIALESNEIISPTNSYSFLPLLPFQCIPKRERKLNMFATLRF